MGIKKESKRVKIGGKLKTIEADALSAINSVKSYNTQLANLKITLEADNDFKAEDIAEVQDLIDSLRVEINNI